MQHIRASAAIRVVPFPRAGASGVSLQAALMEFWGTLRRGLFDGYRPERHYMRGPGPKCGEKARLHGEAR